MEIDELRAKLVAAGEENARLRAENARLLAENADLGREARHDPLTGLLNRAGMRRVWDDLQERWTSGLQAVTGVIMCDSDHFKAVNDTLDHRTGDIVLCKLAETITIAVGKAGRTIRTGGDEFIVIVTDGDPVEMAETIRRMADYHMVIKGHDVYVTLSIGVAVNPTPGIRLVDILDYADHETMRSKQRGRNRVSVIYLDQLGADVAGL